MRYSGKIGYAVSTEIRPGVWEDVITERDYVGDVMNRTEVLNVEGSILPQYRTTTSISVLSDGVDKLNYEDIRYVSYMGINWSIASVIFQFPRLTLQIGEKYNGPTP